MVFQGRSMAPTRLLVVFLGATLPLLFFTPAEAGNVEVSYGRVANNLPDPASVVKLQQRCGITMVRLYDADPHILRAFANTGIKVLVMLPNAELAAAAENPQFARQWVTCNLSAHRPATLIDGVAVGNEVFKETPNLTSKLVPAMVNVQRALAELGLADEVQMSTPIAFNALKDTFPPSSGRFRDDIAQSVMKPMLEFLARTGSYLTVNPYPFFAYAEQPQHIPLEHALGNYEPGFRDWKTSLVYHSLLDAMMDAPYFTVENLTEHLNIRLKWRPSRDKMDGDCMAVTWKNQTRGKPRRGQNRSAAGGGCQPSPATLANAKAYNNYLINRVKSGRTGTPYRPDADMEVYIFALFNENLKRNDPDDAEGYFGLFHPNMTKVFEFDFDGGESWCVANAAVGDARLQAALDYACGHGADCCAIQPGGQCFEPNTRVAHASYAFNSYYQRNHRAPGTCDFAGAARVVYCQPKFGNCALPSKANPEGYAAI